VKINTAIFADGGDEFIQGTVYNITDVSDASGEFRTSFFDADYLYTDIPTAATNITGICNSTFSGNYITSRTSADLEPSVVVPTISVISPNGYEQWNQGSTYDITWLNIDFTGNVNVYLLKGPFASEIIAPNIVNTGTWAWPVPEDQTLGGDYKIKVAGVNTGDPFDISDEYFNIVPAVQVPDIVINEINYNPPESGTDTLEFIELYNNSGFEVDITGWKFVQGVVHTFAEGTIMPDEGYLVVAYRSQIVEDFYGITGVVQWTSGGLSNGGETIELTNENDAQMDIVTFSDSGLWPSEPDGFGPSLELIDPNLDNSLPASWAASLVNYGTPGVVNSVFGAEVITLTSPNGGETYEQGGSEEITWTSFGFTGLVKIELITAAKDRAVLAENVDVTTGVWDWEIDPDQTVGDNFLIKISDMDDGEPMDESDAPFTIVSQIIPTVTVEAPDGGEEWTQGTTRVIDWSQEFFTGNIKIEITDGITPTVLVPSVSVTTGFYSWDIPVDFPVGTNYKVVVSEVTTGIPSDESNAPFSIVAPVALPDLVINEIMYNSTGDDNEWMEIYNLGDETVDLEGYYILDDDDAHTPVEFPAGYSIEPQQYFTISLELLNPPLSFVPNFEGNAQWALNNGGDNLRLFHSSGQLIDSVSYTDASPWPTSPDGTGPSLSLLSPELDNDLGENWLGSVEMGGTPGAVNFTMDPTITVSSPNGGEEIQQGTTFDVTWTSANYTGTVAIEIVDGESTLLGNADVADGEFSWSVTQDLGTNYKIRVSDQATGDPWDESDEVFSIVEPAELPKVVINEIMYNSPEGGTDSLEFIELYNNDVMSVNLENWYFSLGVVYTFPNFELAPGEYAVVGINAPALMNTFGIEALQWESQALGNSGEPVELRNAEGDVIDYVDYDDGGAWNKAADGYGPSLTLMDPMLDNSLPENWYVETFFAAYNADMIGVYGTPGSLNNPDPAQGIYLGWGWGGISSYTGAADPTLETIIDEVATDVFMMQHFSDLYLPSYGINTIMNWNNDLGYQVKMDNARYLVIYGDMVADKSVDLTEGWNILPVLSECAVDVATFLGGATEVIFAKDLSSNDMYWPDGGITTLTYLLQGHAYFIKVSTDVTLTFPDCVAKAIPTDVQKQSNTTSWNDIVPTNNSHAVGFAASALNILQDGDVIGAFTANGLCAGMATVGSDNASMLVWGDDIYTFNQDGFVENETLKFMVYRSATGEQFEVEAIYDQNFGDAGQFAVNGISFVTDLKAGSTGFGDYNEVSVSIYPNPAKETLNIVLSDFRASSIEIYSSLGQKVYTGEIAGEQSRITISTLQKGLYFLKVYDNISGKQETLSFIKE
jgi:hypothetical protein